MEDLSTIKFDAKKCKKAQALDNLTSEELFHRYFMRSDKRRKILADFEIDLERHFESSRMSVLRSFAGSTLNTICNSFDKNLPPYIPEGYALNTTKLLYDLEELFSENKLIAQEIALNNPDVNGIHPYAKGVIYYYRELLNRALKYVNKEV